MSGYAALQLLGFGGILAVPLGGECPIVSEEIHGESSASVGFNSVKTAAADRGRWTVESSGLKWRRVSGNGKGLRPTRSDSVTIRYVGCLADGSIFDRSGGNQNFNLSLETAILGWKESFVNFGVGDTFELVVPPSSGYGSIPLDRVPPNSTLYFSVKLVGVNEPRPGPKQLAPPWPSSATLLPAVELRSGKVATRITVDGNLVANWYLSTASYDFLEVSRFGVAAGSNICVESDVDKACTKVDEGQIGVFRIWLKRASYSAYIGILFANRF